MIGQTLSHYRIVAPLGSGGMGVVYEAEDTRLGRKVAVKMLPEGSGADAQAMERFLREARIVSSLSHPHICVLHDIGEHQGRQFMVMELLEGESLRERLARGPMRLDDVLEIGAQIADALDAAHAQGVIHRDIKPANLFITRRGQVKVLDFGVAKLAEVAGTESDLIETSSQEHLTTIGSAIGTIGYMSPEQARGEDIDGRSDLFSFGVVLYEMACGRLPFPGATAAVVFEGILTKTPAPPSTFNANIPAELDRIVEKALEKDRETRYQSAADIRADLKRLRRETDAGRTPAFGTPAVATSTASVPSPAAVATLEPPAPQHQPAFDLRHLRNLRAVRPWMVGAPLVTVAIVGGVLLWQSTRAPALTARDTVVLTDFANRTGDTMFDDTLGEALALQLRQSPFLNLLSEQQMQGTLRLMGRDPTSRVTSEVGRDLCQRVGGKALLGGTIASLGSSYVVTLAANDCVTGDVLAEEQAQANGKEDVIRVLGSAASTLRERLGESLPSIQRYDTRIEEATTPSLDALKAYSQGMQARRTQGDFESIPFFRRAIELDPNFAIAHARLGTVQGNLGAKLPALEHTTRAYERRDKVSEPERLYIEARYHTMVDGDVEKAIDSYRLLLATYPSDFAALINVALLYKQRGRSAEAAAALEESVRIAPDQPLGHFNLAFVYLDQSRWDEARQAFERTLAIRDGTQTRIGLYTLAMLTGNDALASEQVAAVAGRRDESDMTGARVTAALFQGRMREAEPLLAELRRQLEATGRKSKSAPSYMSFAVAQALAGRLDTARDTATIVERELPSDELTDEMLAYAAVIGDARLSRTWLDRSLAKVRAIAPTRDVTQLEQRIRALDALAARQYDEARTLIAPSASDFTDFAAQFVLGIVDLNDGRTAEAAGSFRRMLANRTQIGLATFVAVAYFYLGRAEAELGNTAAARAAYEEGFKIWHRADPDLPALARARAEFARLGS